MNPFSFKRISESKLEPQRKQQIKRASKTHPKKKKSDKKKRQV